MEKKKKLLNIFCYFCKIVLIFSTCLVLTSCNKAERNLHTDTEFVTKGNPATIPPVINNPVANSSYPHIIKYEDRILKSFESISYPQPVSIAPYYFINQLPVTMKQYSILCPIGRCQVKLDQLISLNHSESLEYLNQQVALQLNQWIQSGLPKYPGQHYFIKNTKVAAVSYSAKIDNGVNDIMKLVLSTDVLLMNQQHIYDEHYIYFDLLTGRQLTINDIMNSADGLEELNRLVLNSIDSFVVADDFEKFYFYQNPFTSGFTSLPKTVSLLLDVDYSSVILNDDCTNCSFTTGHNPLSPIQISFSSNPITLYDRYFNEDLTSHVSEGEFVLNLRNSSLSIDSDMKQTIIDIDKGLTVIGPAFEEFPDYLQTHIHTMVEELIAEAKQAAKQKNITLDKESFQAHLSYHQNRLIETISMSYYVSDRFGYVSGNVIKNFNRISKEEFRIQDIFKSQSNFKEYLRQLLNKNISINEYEVTLDELLSDLNQLDFQINMDSLTINTIPYRFKKDTQSFYSITIDIPWTKIGLDNISPFLLSTDTQ